MGGEKQLKTLSTLALIAGRLRGAHLIRRSTAWRPYLNPTHTGIYIWIFLCIAYSVPRI
jgi:hypothetical protein